MRSLPGNPYDGHTHHTALEQVKNLTKQQPQEVFVDLGYRGAATTGIKVYHRKLNLHYCTAEAGHSATQCHRTGDRVYEE